MNRRSFIALCGAAGVAPAIPLPAVPAPAATAAYSRTLYGHAAFHARTRASLSAADLVARLKVSAVQAEALMGEMAARGVLTPLASGTIGAMRAVSATPANRPDLARMAGRAIELLQDDDEYAAPGPSDAPETQPGPEAGEEIENG